MNRRSICKPEKANRYALLAFALTFAWQICCRAQLPLSGTALENVKTAAESGKPAAEDELASQFMLHGDTTQAKLWYSRAAQQGYIHAQGKLGDMLLLDARLTIGKPDIKAAVASHGIEWLTLAAYQGDTLAQADLAGLYLNGEFVKPDLIESYKWGDLAGSINGRAIRDAAILKMSAVQISEARKQVAAFIPYVPARFGLPEPAWAREIKLSGLGGPKNRPMAIIDNEVFAAGDANVLKVSGKAVTVQCLQIRDKSVVVRIDGVDEPRELMLAQ
jgi:Sel1 repeat